MRVETRRIPARMPRVPGGVCTDCTDCVERRTAGSGEVVKLPELPEVETMVRGIRPLVEGRRVLRVWQPECHCRPIAIRPGFSALSRRSKGRIITSVRRLAKRVVLVFDSTDVVVIEPRMTGLMLVADPPSIEHLRLEWELEHLSASSDAAAGNSSHGSSIGRLWFWDRRGLGTVTLMTAQEFEVLEFGGKLGCDALAMSVDRWSSVLRTTDRAIKPTLLDQKIVAGIGNLYASEILHRAEIHPEQPSSSLRIEELLRLHQATVDILETAIRYEGSTLGDGTYRNVLAQDGGYQNEHTVYDREGEECPRCRVDSIRRVVQTQRSTFYCPTCQILRKRKSRKAVSRRDRSRSIRGNHPNLGGE